MKNVYFLSIILGLSFSSFAQTIDDIGKIAISVVMPQNIEGLSVSQLSKLESKTSHIVTDYGFSAIGYNHNFVIYPKLSIYESNTVEGGMRNITIVTAELTLYIEQVSNNLLFSMISKQIKGSGHTERLAITDAISKINTKDPDYKDFIETGKLKIIAYYKASCSDIIKEADSYAQMQQYEKAIALLMSVPKEASSCYNQTMDKAIQVHKAYETKRCREVIQKANATLANNDYVGTLNILSTIAPSAPCFKEAQTIVRSVERKVDAIEKQQWDLKMKKWNFKIQQHNDALNLAEQRANLEVQRVEAIKEIAISYFKSQPKIYYEL